MEIVTILGVKADAKLTFGELLKRGVQVFETMRAGQDRLDFLKGMEAVLGSRLQVNEESGYELVTEVPKKPQLPLIPHERRGRRRVDLGDLARDDGADESLKAETIALLNASSKLVDRVGEIVSTQEDVKGAIRQLEKETGLDSAGARRFHYRRQGEFQAIVDGEEIVSFSSKAVRTGVTASDLLEVEGSLVPTRAESLVVRAKVDTCKGEGVEGGVTSGGAHSVRIVNPTWWQRVAVEAARGFQWKLKMDLVEVISTCTLERMPADVHRVYNWIPLLEATHSAIGDILRTAIEKGKGPPDSDPWAEPEAA